jgi:hypothetical protein
MAITSLKRSTLKIFNRYNNFLAGNIVVPPDYELISTTVLGSSASSVTFSGLATTAAAYKHLQLRAVYSSNNGASGTYIRMQLNGDTSGNYSFHYLVGQGSSVLSSGSPTQSAMHISPWSSSTSSAHSDVTVTDFFNFSSTTRNKTIRSITGGPGYGSINLVSGAWYSTAAVTSINLLAFSQGSASTFGVGTRFSLYGLRG